MVLTKKHVIISDACFLRNQKYVMANYISIKRMWSVSCYVMNLQGWSCRLQSRAKVSGLQMLVTSYSL